ncbi:MAG: hypothetical protein IPK44_24505 [Candidatus Accumulibacter sp.]|uniref:hypothetical protein n=1 Tax=Accumulibacter sp. TaxID=2053492 RepID=UPI00258DC3FE|nr:hypothetical protein [Accumulibacter sp.]MBK8117452.1 hypothetical protein [Accumulibacter sp.]
MSNNIIATLPNFTSGPAGVIMRGKSGKDLKIEYKADKPPVVIKERLVESKQDGTVFFRKAGETVKTSAELIKEGKLPSKEPPIKPKEKDKVK